MSRPTFIDLGTDANPSTGALSKPARLSPRIQHFDGDVPPSLSPLDAIAARSRKLAKELEETRQAGERRMSRLPPQVVTDSLAEHLHNRPTIFRALSDGIDTVPPLPTLDKDRAGSYPRVAHPLTRPASQRVRMSTIIKLGENEASKELAEAQDYFGAPRVESPPPLESKQALSPSGGAESPSLQPQADSRRVSSHSQSDLCANLAPPPSRGNRLRPYQDASDDDYTSSIAGSTFSQSRKLSSSSGMSAPHSPVSPYAQYHHDRNASSNSLGSPSRNTSVRNFSRPMSSSSMTNLNAERSPTKPSLSLRMNELRGTSSFDNSASPDGYLAGESSSYTHATYSLPRGRVVSNRNSGVFVAISTPHFEWQEPMFPGTPPMEGKSSCELPIPSPGFSVRPSAEYETQQRSRSGSSSNINGETSPQPASLRSNHSSYSRPSIQQQPPPSTPFFMLPPAPLSPVEEMSQSSRSASTVRPSITRNPSNYQGFSGEEHVAKAIELHEHGDLKESTYHLRIAANKGHATGMLLYALACRHGWGMRANQKEGIQWLRKAVDSAMLEVVEDGDPATQKPGADFNEKKTRRAQFALGIYELGVSHLNGWGIEQDKALALRCFEIAGSWGDTDALTEAGFCYAEGIGCKKDLKKAAKFYRKAEAKGVSMIGNSW